MKKKTRLVMPMCGAGSRFPIQDFHVPKPLIEICGMPFFALAASSITEKADIEGITFVVLQDHVENYRIDDIIYEYFPDADIKVLSSVTKGAVYTCLKGIETMRDDDSVIFNDCDHYFSSDSLYRFLNDPDRSAVNGFVTFKSRQPAYSYVKYDADKNITGTVEKQVVSDTAICGAYYFDSAGLFRETAKEYIKDCPYKEFFMSGMYNLLFRSGKKIKTFPAETFVNFGTPESFAKAKVYLDRRVV